AVCTFAVGLTTRNVAGPEKSFGPNVIACVSATGKFLISLNPLMKVRRFKFLPAFCIACLMTLIVSHQRMVGPCDSMYGNFDRRFGLYFWYVCQHAFASGVYPGPS